MIANDVVERVRMAADIVQIVGEHVKLKRTGSDFRGPCPFHQGSGPNFSVSPKRGFYHCFVCSESGDVFTFVRKKLGMEWPEAVKFVGAKCGIDVVDTPTRAQAPDPNEGNWEVLASAAAWFHAQLLDESVGRDARAYLSHRDVDEEAVKRFQLGFAPRDAQRLRKHLQSLGFDDARQTEAGILSLREGETEPRTGFRNRVMFPIVDEYGHHVAFGGRALGDGTPKYLNSAESKVFQKRRTLYGMHSARHAMRRAGRALIVEGYMDAIRVALAGVEEVVAPLGTALTEEQAGLLTRYAPEVFLLYDSDEAGQKATFRTGLELLRHKAAVRVVTFPEGEDPDTFVRAAGRSGLETQLDSAMDLFDRQVQLLDRHGWFNDLTRQRRAIDKLLPTIRAAADPLTRDLYLTRLAEKTRLEKSNLASEAEEPSAADRRASPAAALVREPAANAPPVDPGGWNGEPMPVGPRGDRPGFGNGRPGGGQWKGRGGRSGVPEWRASWVQPAGNVEEPAERALISAMLADRSLAERIAERHPPSDFRDERYKALFGVLLVAPTDEALDEIAERVPDDVAGVLQELLHRADGRDVEAVDVSLNLIKLDVREIEKNLAEVRRKIPLADPSEQILLRWREMDLAKERREVLSSLSLHNNPKG